MRARTRALLLFFVLLVGVAGCDHASKRVAASALAERTVSLAGGALRLELAHNDGAFLSAGADLPSGVRRVLLLGLVPLVVAGLCAYSLRAAELGVALAAGLGLLAGGGLSNWLDRLLHQGFVTDFILLRTGPLQTGVFNVADVAVVAGVLLVVRAQRLTPTTRDGDAPSHGA